MDTVICSVCSATPPPGADAYDGGPIRWLLFVHYPLRHPDRARTAMEKLMADIQDGAA